MAKLKGSPKTGGKTKGSKNKLTKVSKEALASALEGSTEKIKEALSKLEAEPYLYLNVVVKLLAFVIPKQTDITSNGEALNNAYQIDYSKLSDQTLLELSNAYKEAKE